MEKPEVVNEEAQQTVEVTIEVGGECLFTLVVNDIPIPMKVSFVKLTEGIDAIQVSTLKLLNPRVRWVDCNSSDGQGMISINMRH